MSLVSIVVITYNSADFVLQTLDSVKFQTYRNLELIITDDNSTDGTQNQCRNWLADNSSRFVNAVFIESDCNSGIPANCNKGALRASGEWIKFVAGDDILLPSAIERLLLFTHVNGDCDIVHARVIYLYGGVGIVGTKVSENRKRTVTEKMSPSRQFDLLKFSSFLAAPSVFLKKTLLVTLGYFDEDIKLCEDWPFWLKVSLSGKRIYFLNEEVVEYRIHDNSVYSSSIGKFLVHPFI